MIGIYKIISPTNKIYIGQSNNIEKRWEQYKRLECKSQLKLYRSLNKYNWINHQYEIIEECNLEQLNEREIYWGNYYNVLGESGLNLRLGEGRGSCSEETANKISQSSKGRSNFKNKKHSDKTKEKQRLIKLGKKHSQETLTKMRKPRINTNNMYKPKSNTDNMKKPKPEGFSKSQSERMKGKKRGSYSK